MNLDQRLADAQLARTKQKIAGAFINYKLAQLRSEMATWYATVSEDLRPAFDEHLTGALDDAAGIFDNALIAIKCAIPSDNDIRDEHEEYEREYPRRMAAE